MIDEDTSHDPRRHSEEVNPVMTVKRRTTDQPEVSLMNQICALQGMASGLISQTTSGQTAQLFVDQWD
jgi:hypothetical protein